MEVKKYFTTGEEVFHAIVHGVGALLAILGLVLAVNKADTALEMTSVAIFTSTAILLYTMSTLYHSFPKGKTKNVFERFDHLSIYILIAGTYTPFCLITFGGVKGLLLFIFMWAFAIIGVTLKAIWIEKYVKIHVLIYLAMGWVIIFMTKPILNEVTGIGWHGFAYLLVGGISYSIGTIFYVFPLFKFHHAVWHFFVLFGTLLHFLAVYLFIL